MPLHIGLGERQIIVIAIVVVPDGPELVGVGFSCYGAQEVRIRGVWAGDKAPTAAVPLLDQGLVGRRAADEVVAHGPELVGPRNTCHAIQKIGDGTRVLARYKIPLLAIPVIEQYHLSFIGLNGDSSYCPYVFAREACD